ncbi:hypothetical protein BDZ91DRAFT_716904 [Kalaharituber pfeilii]|nr:hypothetical protein BDZ91DRAFT_716904 [Kalaharituber pfeilii]
MIHALLGIGMCAHLITTSYSMAFGQYSMLQSRCRSRGADVTCLEPKPGRNPHHSRLLATLKLLGPFSRRLFVPAKCIRV